MSQPNIYSIADAAGVSIATVSRVLNRSPLVSEKTRRHVEEVMAEMGYTPNVFARGLMRQPTRTIGVLVLHVCDLYYANAVHTAEAVLHRHGYQMLLCCTGDSLEKKREYLSLLLSKRVDGILLIGSVFQEQADNSHLLEAARSVPVVLINGALTGENLYSVTCDDQAGVATAVRHLLTAGHQEIAYLYHARTYSGIQKQRGYENAMRAAGLTPRAPLQAENDEPSGGADAVRTLLEQSPGCTALIAADDPLAIGAYKQAAAQGRPLAVIGYNNSMLAQCATPALSSVDSRVVELTERATGLLLDVLGGKTAPARTVLRPTLIVRDSG